MKKGNIEVVDIDTHIVTYQYVILSHPRYQNLLRPASTQKITCAPSGECDNGMSGGFVHTSGHAI